MSSLNYRTGMREANYTLATGMTDLFNRMRRANVTIYSVDPCRRRRPPGLRADEGRWAFP